MIHNHKMPGRVSPTSSLPESSLTASMLRNYCVVNNEIIVTDPNLLLVHLLQGQLPIVGRQMQLIVTGRWAAIVGIHRQAVQWEATSQQMHGHINVIHGRACVGIALTQDIMPKTVQILMRLMPKVPKILGNAVRIRARLRAVESARVQMNQARRGVLLHGSHPEVRPAPL